MLLKKTRSRLSTSEIKFKPLFLFFISSNSLLLAGSVISQSWNIPQLLLLQWCGICGIFLIYRFNDFIDQAHSFRFNIRRFLRIRLHILVIAQLIFITFPLAIHYLSGFRIVMLMSIGILGILYSLNFPFKGRNNRIKNIFLIKNIFIGFAWGSLILVGADVFNQRFTTALFLFTSLQVVIGSMIRDIPDTARDKTDRVRTLPALFGVEATLKVLHALNVVSVLPAMIVYRNNGFLLFMLIIITWRFISFVKINKQNNSLLWTQTFNLLTCFLIFIILLLQYLFDYY